MRSLARPLTILAAAGVVLIGSALAVNTVSTAGPATADGQLPLVEDYSYPGAAQIKQQRGIELISGDGHLVLVECTGQKGVIEVRAGSTKDQGKDPGHYCFQVTGPTGYLSLRLDDAYQAVSGNHAVTAKITVKDKTATIPVGAVWTGLGIGGNPNQDWATLLELRATS